MKITPWSPQFQKGKHFSMILLAPRRQGKSTLIKYIFEKYDFNRRFDLHVVFSNSLSNAQDPDFYAKFVPGSYQYWDYKPEVMQKLFELQQENISKFGKYLDILIIFDDCVSVKQKYQDDILQVFTRGRNNGMSIMFASQSPALMNKIWRDNCDYALLLFEKDGTNRKKNIENFITCLWDSSADMSGAKLIRVIDREYLNVTKDSSAPHTALVCDYVTNELHTYRAKPK